MREVDGLAHCRLGGRLLPQIALQVDHLGGAEMAVVQVDGVELGGDPEVGGHRALGVLGDQDQAVAGDRLARNGRRRCRVEGHPDRADVVGERSAELVVRHPAEEGGAATQRGDPGRGVGRRPARRLGGLSHPVVDGGRPS